MFRNFFEKTEVGISKFLRSNGRNLMIPNENFYIKKRSGSYLEIKKLWKNHVGFGK